MNYLTPEETVRSPLYFVHNYGVLDIPIEESEVVFYGSLKDSTGKPLINRFYTLEDLSFNERNLRYADMCIARAWK